MALITSMFDKMSDERQQMMDNNNEHLSNMLDFAIQQLVEVCEDEEIMLIDNSRICTTYDQIFECLKHWSEKRMDKE